jgi:hypothetical protein
VFVPRNINHGCILASSVRVYQKVALWVGPCKRLSGLIMLAGTNTIAYSSV